MSYKILEVKVDGAHVKTLVEYTFADSTKKNIEIYHFMPEDKATVILGIENRETSELTLKNAIAKNELIKANIEKDIADAIK